MEILITIAALAFLMYVAYRGMSVILFAPVAALLAVVFTHPALVLPIFSGVYLDKLAGFLKGFLPLFLLGAIFGKMIEISGFAKAITQRVVRLLGPHNAILAVVLVCALLTYGGVSLFVVVFAVYPFATELFRAAEIPRRLIPGTIALGSFTFTMDSLPGSPQIQNIIPCKFFHTNVWAAPKLGIVGALFIAVAGMIYLNARRVQAAGRKEGYGDDAPGATTALATDADGKASIPTPWLALVPLILVGVLSRCFTLLLPRAYPEQFDFAKAGIAAVPVLVTKDLFAIWAVEGALLVGVLSVVLLAWRRVQPRFAVSANAAIAGALLAALNTASEYGFGGVIATMPGFRAISAAMSHAISNPLLNEAITTTTLAGVTGSASGGMSIALATMGQTYLERATQLGIPPEVLHRVAAMASGGMDTLPHNGAVITLLAVTALTHKQAYRDIFAMTLIKTAAVFVVIGFYYATHLY